MMKKLVIVTFFALSTAIVFGQGGKVNSAISYVGQKKLDKAKEAIDLATVHEKTKDKAKTWKVRGEVYQAIATTKDSSFANLCPDPVKVSIEAYKKAKELDEKGRYAKEIDAKLYFFTNSLSKDLGNNWTAKNYKGAHQDAVYMIEIAALQTPPVIDTNSMYNAAITALGAEMYDEAIVYYKKCIDLNYKDGAKMYESISDIENIRGDTAKAVYYLEEGIKAYPDNNSKLMVKLINLYLLKDESDLALKYLTKAIEKEPNNATYLFAQGALYDKLEKFDMSEVSYKKAVEIKPDYFDAYYNLGALYYNKGVEMLKEANNIPANKQKEYEAAVKESYKELEKALPYFEKAYELNAKEISSVQVLKEIYFKLRNEKPEYMEKYKHYNDLLKK
jgi:tetratricopeptide (TPR) repeat protein